MPLKLTLTPEHERELTDEVLVKMGEVTLHTKRAERGFALCYKEGKVVPSTEHIGGPGSISYRNCRGLEKAGSFHTHPAPSNSRPSWWDGASCLRNSRLYETYWVSCVGSPGDGLLRCFTPKAAPDPGLVERLWKERRRHHHQYMEEDPFMARLHREIANFAVRDIPQMVEVPVPVLAAAPYPRSLVECDRSHTLTELRDMARGGGLSPSGDKKELCRRLIQAGIMGG